MAFSQLAMQDKLESVAEDIKKTYSVPVKSIVMDASRHDGLFGRQCEAADGVLQGHAL